MNTITLSVEIFDALEARIRANVLTDTDLLKMSIIVSAIEQGFNQSMTYDVVQTLTKSTRKEVDNYLLLLEVSYVVDRYDAGCYKLNEFLIDTHINIEEVVCD